MTNTANLYAGSRARAADLRNIAPLAAYKSIDETAASAVGTLQGDDALILQLSSGAVYDFDVVFHYSGGTQGSSDLKAGWVYPSGAVMRYTRAGLTIAGAADVGAYTRETDVLVFGTSGSGTRSVRMAGTVSVASSPGTLQLMWCQNSGTATATKVLAGSKLTAVQVQ